VNRGLGGGVAIVLPGGNRRRQTHAEACNEREQAPCQELVHDTRTWTAAHFTGRGSRDRR
jgi:hypothetical protein